MAHIEDIAAMKLEAITERATKKDYFDIAELLSKYSVKEMIHFYSEKYPFMSTRNVINIFKDFSRVINLDIEKTKEPKTFNNLTWENVKDKVNKAFDEFVKTEFQRKALEKKNRKN